MPNTAHNELLEMYNQMLDNQIDLGLAVLTLRKEVDHLYKVINALLKVD